MNRFIKSVLCIGLVGLLAGCAVRTYTEVKDRVDQEITSGNQGYLMGNAPAPEGERRKTRTTYVAEIELGKSAVTSESPAEATPAGNEGYVEGTPVVTTEEEKPVEPLVQYKVQKDDTLQKISKHFFGTTKKWHKIYQLNKDKIKNPDRIKPGMVLDIPKE
ncbi:MAG: LysM peptidoglycan-binding domain-containing protein [Candidatus Omnitrophota bacterium]